MPGYVHIAVYSMARNMYGPEEARRHMAELYGFGETSDGTLAHLPQRNGWKGRIGRRLSVVAATSLALIS